MRALIIRCVKTLIKMSQELPFLGHFYLRFEGPLNFYTVLRPEICSSPLGTTRPTTLYFSRFSVSQSQGSRREREFCSLNLRVRDENEICSLNISGFETRARYFLSKSHVSRWERDMQTNFSRSSEKK